MVAATAAARAASPDFHAPGSAALQSNPHSAPSRIFASALGGRLGNRNFGKLVDGIRSGDQGETNGGKSNKVSFRLQAWRFIIAAPLIKGRTRSHMPRGSVFASRRGSLPKSAEVLAINKFPFTAGPSLNDNWLQAIELFLLLAMRLKFPNVI